MRRASTLISLLLVGITVLPGCGNAAVQAQKNETKNIVQTPKPANVPSPGLTKSDMRVGSLYLGETFASVIKEFGQPSEKTVVHGNGAPYWIYDKNGFSLYGDPVWQIMVSKDFSGSTPRGIHVGSTLKNVEQAYPSLRFVLNKTQLFGKTADKKYSIDFMISNGIVTDIIVTNEDI